MVNLQFAFESISVQTKISLVNKLGSQIPFQVNNWNKYRWLAHYN